MNLLRGFKSIAKDIHRSEAYSERFYLQNDKEAIIPIATTELYSSINPASPNPDVISYLYASVGYIKARKDIIITCTDPSAENTYRNQIAMDIKLEQNRLRYRNLLALGFFLLGATVLVSGYVAGSLWPEQVISETIDIIGTFMIWEAADLFIIQKRETRMTLFGYYRLYAAIWKQHE